MSELNKSNAIQKRKRFPGGRDTCGCWSVDLLRRTPCIASAWRQRGLGWLIDCARTVPSVFYRTNASLPRLRVPSPLFRTSSLYARSSLRQSAHLGTPALGILDRYGPGARPHFRTVASATILLIMRSLKNRLVLLSALVALPFSLFAGTLQTVTLEVKNMTCAVCPITVKKALEKVPGVTDAKVDFDKRTASVSFDPDKANVAQLTKATTDAGYPSSVRN
jgi:periplasmic mercuric ion binding protein